MGWFFSCYCLNAEIYLSLTDGKQYLLAPTSAGNIADKGLMTGGAGRLAKSAVPFIGPDTAIFIIKLIAIEGSSIHKKSDNHQQDGYQQDK